MFLSLVLFGFLGGISGVVMGTEQINLIMHNTLYVPGHFHATVVAETCQDPAVSVRSWGCRHLAVHDGSRNARRVTASLGHPFSDAALSFDYPSATFLRMALNGIFAVLASLGGALYVLITVFSVLFGKKVDASNIVAAFEPMPEKRAPEAVSTYGNAGTWHLPDTYVLVAVFFTTFVLYYFINWKYISEL